MRLRYKIGLIVIAVSLGVCLMTFQSYALWVKNMVAEQENVVEVGCFKINYQDIETTQINLKNTYPVSDKKGLTGKPYVFTITNTCTIDDSYIVTLNTSIDNQKGDVDGQFENPDTKEKVSSYNMTDKVKFAITKVEGTVNAEDDDPNKPEEGKNLGTFAKENPEKNINTDKSQLPEPDKIDQSIIIDSGILKGKQGGDQGQSVTYRLYLWIDEAAGNEVMGQSFQASVHIINHATFASDNEQGDEPSGSDSPLPQDVLDSVIHEDEQDPGGGQPDSDGNGLFEVKPELDGWTEPELRYAGPNPDNYVWFNSDDDCKSEGDADGKHCELWRIIGLVNVKTSSGNIEQRLKIIKASKIADDAWDENGENDWTNASLMKKLNEIDGEQGEYYQQIVTDKSKSMIAEDIVWNIGGVSYDDYDSLYANQWYDKERGTEVYQTSPPRPTTWPKEGDLTTKARVGLIYPSDFGYAVGGTKEKRTGCLKTELYNYDGGCYEYDWLTPTNDWSWTISPHSSHSDVAFGVGSRGYVYGSSVGDGNCRGVAPVVYLASNVKVSSGQGSVEDPFVLKAE